MNRKLILFAALAVAPLAAVSAQTTHPNFTGTWVLDLTKSTASGPLPTSLTWVITQGRDTLVSDREMAAPDIGTVKAHIMIGFDGKAWKNTVPQPGIGDIETSTVTSWDKDVLVITSSGNIQGTDFVQTDRWTLGADGKTLTSRRSVVAEGNEVQSSEYVFTKKS